MMSQLGLSGNIVCYLFVYWASHMVERLQSLATYILNAASLLFTLMRLRG